MASQRDSRQFETSREAKQADSRYIKMNYIFRGIYWYHWTGRSQFLGRRHALVHWMHDLGATFNLCPASVHSAVYLLDNIMDNLNCLLFWFQYILEYWWLWSIVEQATVHITAIACLMIASKNEEAEVDIPCLADVIKRTGNAFRKQDIISMEISILDYYAWHGPLQNKNTNNFISFYLFSELGCSCYVYCVLFGAITHGNRCNATSAWSTRRWNEIFHQRAHRVFHRSCSWEFDEFHFKNPDHFNNFLVK